MTRLVRRRRRRVLLAAGLVVAVVPNVGLRVVVARVEDRRDAAAAAEVAAADREDAYLALLGATREVDGEVAVATRAAGTAAARTEATAAGLASEAAALRDERDRTGADAAATARRLESFQARIAATAAQITDLRTCVGGVAIAIDASDRGDTAGAIAAMQAAAEACRRSQATLGAIDPGVRFPYDFPDPFVLTSGSGYYAYATNAAGGAVQLLRSTDLVTWSFAGTALAQVPSWAVAGATWAPSVLSRGGRYVLYYAVRDRASGLQCISAATATSPAGPFTDSSSGPLLCDLDDGGSIDASPFVAADGTAWLVWKTEGETVGGAASIRSQPLTADGLGVTGSRATLAQVDQSWEGRTIEGPSMVRTPSGLVLLYSANRWNSSAYGMGAAFCDGPAGPCHKVAGPVLATDGAMIGPGGAEAFTDAAGTLRVAFHAWQGSSVGFPNSRYLHIGELHVAGGTVTISVL